MKDIGHFFDVYWHVSWTRQSRTSHPAAHFHNAILRLRSCHKHVKDFVPLRRPAAHIHNASLKAAFPATISI